VNEDERVETGELLGVIPVGRRFEFRTNKGQFISGRVASSLSESYLERIEKEQLVGKIWKAKLRYREVTRFDKRRESCMLLDLSEVST
jgi:predicted polyphosphate/ATP-dependent NAD kinase